jgi:hypothetical protein
MFDKQRSEDQKKISSNTLDLQINEKFNQKLLQQHEKDKEQAIRLEMLKKLKEDEARERYERLQKAKEYREQLEVQSLVKSNMNYQEKLLYKNDIQRHNESPPKVYESQSRSNHSVQSLSHSPIGVPMFTKKTPKTMCFNPITGVLKDTSQFGIGSFHEDPMTMYHKNQNNSSELSAHPAFQFEKFTKHHPKVVQSFPITGKVSGNFSQIEGREEMGDGEFKGNEKHLAEYGALMMQNRNPAYN